MGMGREIAAAIQTSGLWPAQKRPQLTQQSRRPTDSRLFKLGHAPLQPSHGALMFLNGVKGPAKSGHPAFQAGSMLSQLAALPGDLALPAEISFS